MDPNANLASQLRIAESIIEEADNEGEVSEDDALRLAELVVALDAWIRNGGFLPSSWERAR